MEIEKLDALLKDSKTSFVDLLQKLDVAEHIRISSFNLGVSNAHATSFERLIQPLHLIGSTTQVANHYVSQLFAVHDEDTMFDTFILKICFGTTA